MNKDKDKEYDAIDLKVKELLGINPYPNKCPHCGLKSSRGHLFQITRFEINTVDGNVYCSICHQPIKLERIDSKCLCFAETKKPRTYKMNTLRRKKNVNIN